METFLKCDNVSGNALYFERQFLAGCGVEKLEHTEISYQPRAREFDALLFAERKLILHHSPLRN